MNDRFDWLAYAEQTQDIFIERFAYLNANEHPDKAIEIASAKRAMVSRDRRKAYREAIDDMMRQYIINNPDSRYSQELLESLFPPVVPLDNFGIKAEDVQRRIKQLQQD